ncbi:MAG: dienelactone hydrolase family protein [Sedimentisphaerales bacterium]|nr:dienelactone hydrolase family protein [Sedimentisphaerales bacterium]
MHHRCDPDYVGPKQRRPDILDYYSYPKRPIEARVETLKEKRRYIIQSVEFPSALNVFSTETIKVDYYMQKKEGKFPTVLILPISGGIDFSVTSFAGHFASHGFNCAVVHNREADLESTQSAEEIEDYFRQTVLDNRQVLDYLAEREEVDANKLGCLGLSLGGIRASMLAGVDERVKCVAIGLAGGSIADITMLTGEREIKNQIKDIIAMGATPELIYTELSEKVVTDPIRLAPYADARNVLMFIAMFDQVVPRDCCDWLWESCGKPEVIYLPSGHYGSFLFLPYAVCKTFDFFEEKFCH